MTSLANFQTLQKEASWTERILATLFETSSARRVTPARAPAIGLFLILVSIVSILGWVLGNRALASLGRDWQPMPATAAACFILVGCALLLHRLGPACVRLRPLFGVSLLLVLSLQAIEIGVGASWTDFHNALNSSGKMSSSTMLGLCLTSLILIVMDRCESKAMGQVIQTLTALVMAVGLVGALGYVINLEFLLVRQDLPRMAFTTSVAFTAVALGLWCAWCDAAWNAAEPDQNNVASLYRTIDVLLIVIAATIALVSFGLSQARTEKLTAEGMRQRTNEARDFFDNALRGNIGRANLLVDKPILAAHLRRQLRNSNEAAVRAHLSESTSNLLNHGFSGYAYTAVDGQPLMSVGTFVQKPGIIVALNGPSTAELLWKDGYVLRTKFPLRDKDGVIAYMLAEQPLPELTRFHAKALEQGETSDLVVCTLRKEKTACFPFRWSREPSSYPAYLDGKPLPLTRAVQGETATTIAMDFRRQRVMAAFGPIGDSGLGLAMKMDVWELYAPIRTQFFTALPFIALLVAAGVLVMQLRLRPLVLSLDHSRKNLEFMANHDSLTGLPNRSLFQDRLEQAMARAQRSSSLLAVMYLDIDHFKKINDTFGHHTGDIVLRWFAEQLRTSVRAPDTVARLGGDEFTVILEGLATPLNAEMIAQTIRKNVNSTKTPLTGFASEHIGTSIGIALYHGEGWSSSELLQRADSALYEAKKQGRNTWRVA